MSLNEPFLDADARTWSDCFFDPPPNKKFLIPNYQRKYSWTEIQVQEFWDDLITSKGLFIGSVMIRNINKSESEIIDGQQRYLNITMLCAIIRNQYKNLNNPAAADQADLIHGSCISRRSMKGDGTIDEPFFVPGISLQKIFKENIQSNTGAPLNEFNLPSNSTKEEILIKSQFEYLDKKVKDHISRYSTNKEKQEELTNIWEKICELRIILMEIEDEIQAYEIFESINDKGINLNVGDLVKNAIFKSLHDLEGMNDKEGKWESIIDNVEKSGISMIVFLKYYWGSKYTYVPEKKLYKEIKNKFKTPKEWEAFFNELFDASEHVKHIKIGGIESTRLYEKHHSAYKALYQTLLSFRTFSADTWLVLMMCIFRNRNFLPKQMKETYKEFERLTFVYYLMGLRSNTFHSKIYGTAKEIEALVSKGSDRNTIKEKFTEFFDYIKKKFPQGDTGEELFKERFKELKYEEGSSYIKYIFTEAMSDSSDMPDTGWNNEVIEIEHILPQSPSEAWGLNKNDVKSFVHNIGNLALITRKANSSIDNDSYDLKLKTYETLVGLIPQMKQIVNNSKLRDNNPKKWRFDKITKDNFSCLENRATVLASDAWDHWKPYIVVKKKP